MFGSKSPNKHLMEIMPSSNQSMPGVQCGFAALVQTEKNYQCKTAKLSMQKRQKSIKTCSKCLKQSKSLTTAPELQVAFIDRWKRKYGMHKLSSSKYLGIYKRSE